MAQQTKVLAAEPDNLSLIPQDPHGGRKKLTPLRCPLTSTLSCSMVLNIYMSMRARTHTLFFKVSRI